MAIKRMEITKKKEGWTL